MRERINLLQHKLHVYQLSKDHQLTVDWILLKDIINLIAEILISITEDLPDRLKWLGNLFLLAAQILKSLANALPGSSDSTSDNKG